MADEAIIVNFHDSFFYSLNPVGTFIWERCDGRHSLAQIARALAAEYEVTLESASQDCRKFVEELAEQGLLLLRPEPEPPEVPGTPGTPE